MLQHTVYGELLERINLNAQTVLSHLDNLSVGLSIRQDKTTDQSYSNFMHNLPVCVASHHLANTYDNVQCTSIPVL